MYIFQCITVLTSNQRNSLTQKSKKRKEESKQWRGGEKEEGKKEGWEETLN